MRHAPIWVGMMILACGPAWAQTGTGTGIDRKEACAAAIKDAKAKPGGKDVKKWKTQTDSRRDKRVTVNCVATPE